MNYRVCLSFALLFAMGCAQKATDTTSESTLPNRSDGPAATLTPSGNASPFIGELLAQPLSSYGYQQLEYIVSGRAVRYQADSSSDQGLLSLSEGDTAEYATRAVVRYPIDPAKFSGTLIVEWHNVSSGIDAAPGFGLNIDEITRSGAAWVGVSAQHIGVEGGPVLVPVGGPIGGMGGQGLKKLDSTHYSSLRHPGDAYAYDIFSQTARAFLQEQNAADLFGSVPRHVIAYGESQSAFTLTTYANGVQPLTGVFDGFFIHSRGGGSAPLGEPGAGIDMASSIAASVAPVRTDTSVPVMIVETESDLLSPLNFVAARQADTEMIRTWEIAGSAHADRDVLGAMADQMNCGVPINEGLQKHVVQAALRALTTWITDGTQPPVADRISIENDQILRDRHGIAQGGIRLPQVAVPNRVSSATPGNTTSLICLLLGSTVPMDAQSIASLYPDKTTYLASYERVLDELIQRGFVLREDRQELLDRARPELLS